MSAPQITLPDDVLAQLIRWVHGFLHHKRADPESEARTRSLDMWTGFQLALAELQCLRLREHIDWHDVGHELPDADTTVLICSPDDDEPVWLGWYEDGDGWYEVGGGERSVVRWAHLPAGGTRTPS